MNKTEIYKYYGWNPEDGDYIRENEDKENSKYYKNIKILFYLRLIINKIHKIFL